MRVYVDFDGTLFQNSKFPDPGHPIPGALDFLRYLKAQGHYIVIYSTRASRSGINSTRQRIKLLTEMRQALNQNHAIYDEISEDKPPWDILIDDRCIQFKGDYGDIIAELNKFEPLDWSVCDGELDDTFYQGWHPYLRHMKLKKTKK